MVTAGDVASQSGGLGHSSGGIAGKHEVLPRECFLGHGRGLRAHNNDGVVRFADDSLGNGAKEQALKSAKLLRADDDAGGLQFVGQADQFVCRRAECQGAATCRPLP